MIVKRYYGLMSYDYILPCCTTIAPNSYDYRMPCRTTWVLYKHDSLITKIITLWFSAPFPFVHIFNIRIQIKFSWKFRNLSKENIKRISRIVLAGTFLLILWKTMKFVNSWYIVTYQVFRFLNVVNTSTQFGFPFLYSWHRTFQFLRIEFLQVIF